VSTTAKLAVRIVLAVAKRVLRAMLSLATVSSREGGGGAPASLALVSATAFALRLIVAVALADLEC
jgi:hypothetical protein